MCDPPGSPAPRLQNQRPHSQHYARKCALRSPHTAQPSCSSRRIGVGNLTYFAPRCTFYSLVVLPGLVCPLRRLRPLRGQKLPLARVQDLAGLDQTQLRHLPLVERLQLLGLELQLADLALAPDPLLQLLLQRLFLVLCVRLEFVHLICEQVGKFSQPVRLL